MKLDVINLDGGKGGSIELSDEIFGIAEIRADILQRCVTWQLAKRRAGTHKIQVRNEVSRTGKKMAGHLGQETVTTLNVTVWRVDVERGLILVRGAVPGTEGTYVKLRDAVKSAAPEGVPTPGAYRKAGQPSVAEAAAETPAEESAVTEAPADEAAAPEAGDQA